MAMVVRALMLVALALAAQAIPPAETAIQRCARAQHTYAKKVSDAQNACKDLQGEDKADCNRELSSFQATWNNYLIQQCAALTQEERKETCRSSRAAYSKRVNEYTKGCAGLKGAAEIACYAKLGELSVWYSAVETTCKLTLAMQPEAAPVAATKPSAAPVVTKPKQADPNKLLDKIEEVKLKIAEYRKTANADTSTPAQRAAAAQKVKRLEHRLRHLRHKLHLGPVIARHRTLKLQLAAAKRDLSSTDPAVRNAARVKVDSLQSRVRVLRQKINDAKQRADGRRIAALKSKIASLNGKADKYRQMLQSAEGATRVELTKKLEKLMAKIAATEEERSCSTRRQRRRILKRARRTKAAVKALKKRVAELSQKSKAKPNSTRRRLAYDKAQERLAAAKSALRRRKADIRKEIALIKDSSDALKKRIHKLQKLSAGPDGKTFADSLRKKRAKLEALRATRTEFEKFLGAKADSEELQNQLQKVIQKIVSRKKTAALKCPVKCTTADCTTCRANREAAALSIVRLRKKRARLAKQLERARAREDRKAKLAVIRQQLQAVNAAVIEAHKALSLAKTDTEKQLAHKALREARKQRTALRRAESKLRKRKGGKTMSVAAAKKEFRRKQDAAMRRLAKEVAEAQTVKDARKKKLAKAAKKADRERKRAIKKAREAAERDAELKRLERKKKRKMEKIAAQLAKAAADLKARTSADKAQA